MALHELKPGKGSRTTKRRVGRGDAGRRGSTAGRGLKGQKARGQVHPLFEGGQLPIVKRLPFMRGFNNRFRISYLAVNIERLKAFEPDSEVTPHSLLEAGIVTKPRARVKILGDGELDRPLKVSAHGFSKTAREKIEGAGGSVTVLEPANAAAEAAPLADEAPEDDAESARDTGPADDAPEDEPAPKEAPESPEEDGGASDKDIRPDDGDE